jgi:CheY-like chemotaxis protein
MTKILIVEDNVPNLDMLSRRLEKRGYQVISATDGEQGVKRARTDSPNLILMDLSLPGLDGWEATKILKSDIGTFNTPIIALTAHAMVGDRDRAIEAGCSDYDTKPVDISRLVGKIERSLLASEMSRPQEG